MLKHTARETEYLLHLVFCALHGKEPEEAEGVDYSLLFELAKQQEIYNLINEKLQRAEFIPQEVKETFRNQSMSELNKMIALSAQRNVLYSELTENEIKFMPLKGLIFKDYYPKESMRQMSDNDILIDEAKRKEAASIMEKLGFTPVDTTQNSDDFFKEPYYTFELHRSLFDEESNFSPRFECVWENAKQDENNEFLYHMSKEDVYIFSVCHMYKHYIKACCGIRFLVDNYLFLKKEGGSLNREYINSELEKFELSDYEKQTKSLAMKVFDGEELSEEEKKLLSSYTDFGIYGNNEGKHLQAYSALSQDNSKAGAKFKYFLHRLFPKKSDMLYLYPVLEKKPYLLPFMLIHRFFKGIFHFKETKAEIQRLNQIEKEN
ncbi:MAG: hypothetical protein E7570_09465 [Ruminococcaceae bacterium]|nr:hypothetical protein [Oscillospiraceae bacterium]